MSTITGNANVLENIYNNANISLLANLDISESKYCLLMLI